MAQQSMVGTHRTNIRTEDGSTRVRYHNTDVVSFDRDLVTLDTGGWETATTKLRMNQASNQFGLGYRVYQKDFDWFVETPNGNEVPFTGNIISFNRSK